MIISDSASSETTNLITYQLLAFPTTIIGENLETFWTIAFEQDHSRRRLTVSNDQMKTEKRWQSVNLKRRLIASDNDS